jgi:HNH endonuclease
MRLFRLLPAILRQEFLRRSAKLHERETLTVHTPAGCKGIPGAMQRSIRVRWFAASPAAPSPDSRRSQSGDDSEDNLITLCSECHIRIHEAG